MPDPSDSQQLISPARVLGEIAAAIPEHCRENMIVIGSLAVGYHYFAGQDEMAVRTKDADCLLSPRVQAIPTGIAITEMLFDENWSFKGDEARPTPGNKTTPDDELPAVRIQPPGESQWFLELLTVPESPSDREKRWVRLKTRHGHFGLPSFGYLSLANYKPILTALGIYVAQPEMMALANLLEHQELGSEIMSTGFAGRPEIKRSNKDLGRVLAIAYLAAAQNEDALVAWSANLMGALKSRFPDDWRALAGRSGAGLRSLLDSDQDLEQAWHTCVNGLLASNPPSVEALRIAGQRLLQDAILYLETENG